MRPCLLTSHLFFILLLKLALLFYDSGVEKHQDYKEMSLKFLSYKAFETVDLLLGASGHCSYNPVKMDLKQKL